MSENPGTTTKIPGSASSTGAGASSKAGARRSEYQPQKVLSSSVANFRVTVRLADQRGRKDEGIIVRTNYLAGGGSGWSRWAGDSNKKDPDAIELGIEPHLLPTDGPLAKYEIIHNKDFRLGIMFADQKGAAEYGDARFTPWASEGGGWSRVASDFNAHDPDVVRLRLDTRPWPQVVDVDNRKLLDVRFGVKLFDGHGRSEAGVERYTLWLSVGGGGSGWAMDENKKDFDAAKICLQVRTVEEYHDRPT